jgi:endonuclease/exonuclease/phosphatase family protein
MGCAALCKIIFWNVNRKDLTSLVCDMARDTEAHAIVLNEWVAESQDVLKQLRSKVNRSYDVPTLISSESRFQCFRRDKSLDLTEVHKGFRTSVRKLNTGSTQALLALVHGADIRNNDEASRQSAAHLLAEDFRFVGSQQGHNRLILMGDFNMNPFDRGMNLAAGLNAMMTRNCVKKGQRTFMGRDYDFYYNPMWGLLGDRSVGPPGTIYDTSNQGPYGWSMLDQVLLSHSLVNIFGDVQIITKAGAISLIDANGRPDERVASDHLPILTVLKGDKNE